MEFEIITHSPIKATENYFLDLFHTHLFLFLVKPGEENKTNYLVYSQ